MNEHIRDRGVGLAVGNKPVRGRPEFREKKEHVRLVSESFV